MNQVKKNFLYNMIYQLLLLLIPLITIPFVSRKLGADGIGIYSYTYSIVYYFMIFAMLGLNNYGIRTIAKVRDDKQKLSITFQEIYLLQILTSLLMIALYYFYIFFFVTEYKEIALLQSIYLISCVFDINWFFFGLEQFKITVLRNIVVKLLSFVCIFFFIQSSDDLWKYTFILASSILFSQVLLLPFLKKYVTFQKISFSSFLKHFYPCFKLFLPVIAVTIYKIMDKTMIGWFSDISEVGYYENAEKIINVPVAIINALGTIMLPTMSNYYANRDVSSAKEIIQKSMKFVMFLALPMVFGLMAIGKDFSILFFGESFAKSGSIIILLSITILFLAWGNVIRTQFLIPNNMDNEYIISAFLGAFSNLLFNFLFIPKYHAMGACIGTIVAEFLVVLYQSFQVRKELPLKHYFLLTVPLFYKSLLMFLGIYFLGYFIESSIMRLCFQIFFGFVIYIMLNIRYCFYLMKSSILKRND